MNAFDLAPKTDLATQAAADAAAEAAKKEPVEQIPEADIPEMVKNIGDSLFGPPMEKTKTPEETAAEEKAKKEADDKAAAEAKEKADKAAAETKPQKPAKPAKSAAPTADEIADKVADRMKTEPVQKPAPAVDDLPPEDKHNREVLAELAVMNPEEYGKHVEQFDRFVKLEASYKARWTKAHPDAEFDPEAEDHKEFYEKNQPTFVAEDFSKAEARVEGRKVAQETIEQADRKRTWEAAVKHVNERLAAVPGEVRTDLIAQVDPELAKIKDLDEEDPLASAAIRPLLPALTAKFAELEKGFEPNLGYKFNGQPIQLELVKEIGGYEHVLSQADAKLQVLPDGRKFATIEDFNQMTPKQRESHWTVWMEPKIIKAWLVADASDKAKADLTRLRGFAGKTKAAPASEATPKEEPAPVTKPATAKPDKRFPNTSGGADGVAAPAGASIVTPSEAKSITQSLFG